MATWNSDGTPGNIQSIHDNNASDGDTITFPSGGPFDWTSGVTITKGITVSGLTTVDSTNNTFNDLTIVTDSRPTDAALFTLSPAAGKTARLTGVTFKKGSTTTTLVTGLVVFIGFGSSGARVRMDHCHIYWTYRASELTVAGAIYGVIDHNIYTYTNTDTPAVQSIIFRMADWGGDNEGVGDGSWADYPWFGTDKFMFFEDNYIDNQSGLPLCGNTDADFGSRFVVRHNHGHDFQIQTHGTEGPYRGSRCGEIYNNDLHFTTATSLGGIRTGSYLFHDNTFSGAGTSGLNLVDLRFDFFFLGIQGAHSAPCGFSGATGNNPWDVNATESDGTHVDGHPPYLFASGTCASGSNTTTVKDNGTPGWTVDQWKGFSVQRVSDDGMCMILSNTSDTLTVSSTSGGYGSSPTWTAGDQYKIRKALTTIDQPGRGKCDLLVGGYQSNRMSSTTSLTIGTGSKTLTVFGSNVSAGKPVTLISQANVANTMTGTVTSYDGTTLVCNITSVTGSGTDNTQWNVVSKYNSVSGDCTWPNQALEPCYSWNNGGDPYGFTVATPYLPDGTILQSGRDYYNNSSSSAVIAKYTASLNGVDYTGTFTYPHPLVSGGVTPSPGHGKKHIIRRRQ